jgi:hypothetical protein
MTAIVGSNLGYTITATNGPATIEVKNLPTGLTFDPVTNTVSGTPKSSAIADVTISATNAVGESTALVKLLALSPPTPLITTSSNVYATASEAFAYPIAVNTDTYYPFNPYTPFYNSVSPPPLPLPPTITAHGLPPGMFFNPATQQIEGTATEAGDYIVELTAGTALGETTTRITLHVDESPTFASLALQISSNLDLDTFGAVGSTFSLNIFPVGLATDLVSTELPPGIVLSQEYGVSNGIRTLIGKLSGNPTKSGVYPVKFTFSNAEQSASAIVTIVIPEAPELPLFSGAVAASGTVGKSFSYYIGNGSTSLLNNAASIYAISGLPPGLSFDQKGSFISGTPTTAGRYVVPISLTNSGGTTDATMVLTISDPTSFAPRLGIDGSGLAASETGYIGEKFNLTLTPPDSEITALDSSELPTGLNLQKTNTGAWTLSGTSSEAGIFRFSLTATSSQGSMTIPLTLQIRQLDSSTPPPPPEPTPTPNPNPSPTPTGDEGNSAPPNVILNKPRKVDTNQDHITIRGHVLDYARNCHVIARVDGDESWTKLHVQKNGSFKLRLADLPEGVTKILLRVTNASGRTRTIRLIVHRQKP